MGTPVTPYYAEGGIEIYHSDFRLLSMFEVADCIITDPPYAQTSLDWDRWVSEWPSQVRLSLKRGGSMWCFGSLRMFMEHAAEFADWWHFAQDIVWEKHNGSNFHADRFRRVHEQVAHFYPRGTRWDQVYNQTPTTPDATKRTVRRKERPPHTGEIADSTYTSMDGGPRLQRSVMQVRSMHGQAQHPTQKPVGIILPLIEASCPPGGTVFDPFAGSGTTAVAARALGRKAILIEAEERYCEIAVQRLAQGVLEFS
jgi:site-specific DNA-methyltransferase (adenine-specific)